MKILGRIDHLSRSLKYLVSYFRFHRWSAQARDANSSLRPNSKLLCIPSSDLPVTAPEGLDSHRLQRASVALTALFFDPNRLAAHPASNGEKFVC